MGALSHLRIVEIGSAAATSYCARLFADFGATVQKIEPPAGDPLRRAAPLTPKGNSAWFAFLNFNKSSIALDPNDPNASSRLAELIAGCDILLDGRDVDARELSGDRSRRTQAASSRAHSSRGELVRRRGALRQFRGDGLHDSRAGRSRQTGRSRRGHADACAGFPDRHLRRPLGFHRRRLVGAGADAGWARPLQPAQHFRVLHRRHRIHHVRGVLARRHHAADRCQSLLADLSGRHLRDQTGLARRHHGDPGAMAFVLRDAGIARAARRRVAVPRRRPLAACGDDREQVPAEAERANRAGMVRRSLCAARFRSCRCPRSPISSRTRKRRRAARSCRS